MVFFYIRSPPQLAKLFIAVSVLLTFVLQYFVCLDILWDAVKDHFVKREKMYNGFCRMTLVGGSGRREVRCCVGIEQVETLTLCFAVIKRKIIYMLNLS